MKRYTNWDLFKDVSGIGYENRKLKEEQSKYQKQNRKDNKDKKELEKGRES
ncbi:MAG: hypothetical protein QXX77_08020 [Candidatus Methanosuratincola sp.]